MRKEFSISFTLAWDPTQQLKPLEIMALRRFMGSVDGLVGGELLRIKNHGSFQALSELVEYRQPFKTLGMKELKLETIKQALKDCDGNTIRAAKQLGLSRSTIKRYVKIIENDKS